MLHPVGNQGGHEGNLIGSVDYRRRWKATTTSPLIEFLKIEDHWERDVDALGTKKELDRVGRRDVK